MVSLNAYRPALCREGEVRGREPRHQTGGGRAAVTRSHLLRHWGKRPGSFAPTSQGVSCSAASIPTNRASHVEDGWPGGPRGVRGGDEGRLVNGEAYGDSHASRECDIRADLRCAGERRRLAAHVDGHDSSHGRECLLQSTAGHLIY